MDIRTIIKIDDLIRRGATGSPSNLASCLNLSERAIYKYLKFMKEELKSPIEFSKYNGTYRYATQGEFNFKWKKQS